MSEQLATQYDPAATEQAIYKRWLDARAFSAEPDHRAARYVVMMPLPNVTGALHMGHAMDNVMQDLLVRWHRMRGDNTLWMAGTDHAGIATQAVVEKRLFELEGKTRHDLGREELVQRIWDWKDQYQRRIVLQQQAMGCSCDWARQRFTLDPVCARAVRWTFFNLFRDGLIYQGNRLVNWDCLLQTAVSDDEIAYETVAGNFWHLRYPVIDPAPGEPKFVVVATTRPETMLGDTAVACHPDPKGALTRLIDETQEKTNKATPRERPLLEQELSRLRERMESHLPDLLRFVSMARAKRKVRLPLVDREIPLILDEWAKPDLGSGCVKITPAHDPNDHEVWKRHRDKIEIVNILNPNGSLNENAGPYRALDRFVARKRVVADLDAQGLLAASEQRQIEIGHSDRSKTPIEPFVSKQWFVRMGDISGGVVCGHATKKQFITPGLAQAAIDAAYGDWVSPSGRKLSFHPDAERYAATYIDWLAEKRDWCISRQLWWGHRIPIWAGKFDGRGLAQMVKEIGPILGCEDVSGWLVLGEAERWPLAGATLPVGGGEVLVCLRDTQSDAKFARILESAGLRQDPDVLDTWFSSGLWPHSTLGWPTPADAQIDAGQAPLGAHDGNEDCLDYYYPGSCLATGREIITLWVARMVVMGLYNLGDIPFTDVFLHANILDGKGEKMSKSKGNGIDPVDIIERYGTDAMRYVLCDMQTGTQDIRLPVQAISPFTGNAIDLAKAKHGRSIFSYLCPETGREFDVLGSLPDLPSAKLVSDRFDVGRNFANKLWNAARFALLNLDGATFTPRKRSELADEDRWILSRLATAVRTVHGELEAYNPSAAIGAARDFFWSELCDWYLEIVKPRLKDPASAPVARQVLAVAIDHVLRLLHPFVPFITESIWQRLGALVPVRGIAAPLASPELLILAPWPAPPEEWIDAALEERFRFVQEITRAIRDIRNKHKLPVADKLTVRVRASGDRAVTIAAAQPLLCGLAGLSSFDVTADAARTRDSATAVVRDVEIFVLGAVNIAEERTRLQKHRDRLAAQIDGLEKKIANENFRTRAAAEVVASESKRLFELKAELGTVEQSLAALD